LPKNGHPCRSRGRHGDSAPRKPLALCLGRARAPCAHRARAGEARSTEVAPMTGASADRSHRAGRERSQSADSGAAALRQKKVCRSSLSCCGRRHAALAVATWAARQTATSRPRPPLAASASADERDGRGHRAADAPLRAPSPHRKVKTDSGKQLEAVDARRHRVPRRRVKGFAEQGYRVGEARFTLKSRRAATSRRRRSRAAAAAYRMTSTRARYIVSGRLHGSSQQAARPASTTKAT
jgi:hypothetical protein